MRFSPEGTLFALLLVAGGALAPTAAGPYPVPRSDEERAQDTAPAQRDFRVVIRKYAVEPTRLEVSQDDLVKITLTSADIAHSFTVDAYRIAKRVGAGQTMTFEFRADRAGTFPIYCNLRQDERCREIRGELVVHER